MSEPTISAARVTELFFDSLFTDDEPHDNMIEANGIVVNVGFHPERLLSHKAEVHDLLLELPSAFYEQGGWSFLNMCDDKHGNQWTGEHRTMEQLLLMGIGLGLAQYLMPREWWPMLPGGMPYLVVLPDWERASLKEGEDEPQ